jgi:hypothetical protein
MTTLYGWTAIPATRSTGLLDVHSKPLEEQLPGFFKKLFTHAPGDTVYGAPKYGARWTGKEPKTVREMRRVARAKPIPYKVWNDHSLRRVDKLIRKQLEQMTPEQQDDLIREATLRAAANEPKED